MVASEQAIPRGPDSDVAINPRKRAVEAVVQIYKHVAKPEGKIDYFRKDDTVVSGNTFLPPGQAERNETTWSRIDVEKEVRIVVQFL